MTDMTDTTTTSDASHDAPGEYADDAAGYYTAGDADRRHQGARRPDRDTLEHPQVRGQAGQPGQPPQAHGHHRRHRPGRRLRRRDARRGRLPRRSRSATRTPRAARTRSPPRAASTPRRTTAATATRVYRLFYDTVKGGDFRARESNVYRLAEVSAQHHRPVRRPGRAVRPRVRRPARQPLLRRRAGLAHLLRPRPDRPAAAARRLPGAGAADRRRHRRDVHPPRDARADRRRRPGPRHRRPRPGHRRDRDPPRRRRRARLRRLRQRLLPVDQRDGLQRHRHLAGAPQGRLLRQPLLHADPPDLHPGLRRPPVAS